MPQSTETISRAPARVQPLDRRRLQAVAVTQPVRHEVHDVAAQHLDRTAKDHRRRDAVDVVVAVNDDPLVARDRAQQALDGLAHAGQQKRIVKLIERGLEKALRGRRDRQPPLAQQPRDDRGHAQGRGRQSDRGFVDGHVLPDAAVHHSLCSAGDGASIGPSSANACPSRPIARNFW